MEQQKSRNRNGIFFKLLLIFSTDHTLNSTIFRCSDRNYECHRNWFNYMDILCVSFDWTNEVRCQLVDSVPHIPDRLQIFLFFFVARLMWLFCTFRFVSFLLVFDYRKFSWTVRISVENKWSDLFTLIFFVWICYLHWIGSFSQLFIKKLGISDGPNA